MLPPHAIGTVVAPSDANVPASDPANTHGPFFASEENDMKALDLRGLVPAPVTPFTRDGEVDHAAIQRLGSWLGSFKGVKGLVVLGHAGEGTFLTADEQTAVIESFIESVKGKIPVIAGITLEGTKVAALEAKRAVKAGAAAGLVYPSHGWLRFGYQKGAPQDRYRVIYEESGMPLILFQYPDATKATYNLETQLEIAAQPGVFAMKNGVRNMRRWDTEIPASVASVPICRFLPAMTNICCTPCSTSTGLWWGMAALRLSRSSSSLRPAKPKTTRGHEPSTTGCSR
jgi:dihydrodipicolinate synthase/N-acetylneuraminate lyase